LGPTISTELELADADLVCAMFRLRLKSGTMVITAAAEARGRGFNVFPLKTT
jgi:hypothetical protein